MDSVRGVGVGQGAREVLKLHAVGELEHPQAVLCSVVLARIVGESRLWDRGEGRGERRERGGGGSKVEQGRDGVDPVRGGGVGQRAREVLKLHRVGELKHPQVVLCHAIWYRSGGGGGGG